MADMTEVQMADMAMAMDIIEKTCEPDAWMWGPDYTVEYCGEDFAGIPAQEISDCASTSTSVSVWILRAWAKRRKIPVPATDWWFYNIYLPGKRKQA